MMKDASVLLLVDGDNEEARSPFGLEGATCACARVDIRGDDVEPGLQLSPTRPRHFLCTT